MDKLLDGLLWYIVFIFSTTLHEASHALAALKLGDRTAHESGHVTLNPIPHIRREPIGTVVVPIISFILSGWMIGWASVPYNHAWSLKYPKKAAKMSLAGPLANLLLVLITAVIIRVGIGYEIFSPPEQINYTHVVMANGSGWMDSLAMFLNVFFSLNLLLFIFNLLPIPPLDGSGLIPFYLSDENARKYLQFISNPSLSFLGIMIAWNLFDYVYAPIHLAVVNILYIGIAHYG
jgi:Zn-dependent protease